jgi:glycosyltransferase involved in cell wall biosynthesis
MKLLFIDPTCPRPYTNNVLNGIGMGGTEMTMSRVCEALFKDHDVSLAQHNRIEAEGIYVPLTDELINQRWDAIVVLRSLYHTRLGDRLPVGVPLYLWLHDLPGQHLRAEVPYLNKLKPTILCVSDWHRTQIIEALKSFGDCVLPRSITVYNPIADDLLPDSTPVEPYKLVFTSSPHKGLKEVLYAFECLRRIEPRFHLHVTNPGYYGNLATDVENVHSLGVLPHAEVMKHVRSALCVFYPNYTFPETFGMVFAESNAVGTPVIAHPLGASREIVYHPHEIVNCRDVQLVVDRVITWAEGDRPTVKAHKEFRLVEVMKKWYNLLRRN